MKFIDKRGRLFGLINVIDFFVLIFLLAIAPVFYFGYKLVIPRPVVSPGKGIVVNCELLGVDPAIVSVGDGDIGASGTTTAEIIEVALHRMAQGKARTALRPCDVKLKLKAQIKDGGVYYNDKAIDYNSEFVFETDKYRATARVKEDISRYLNVRVLFKGFDKEAVSLIRVGDRELDSDGRVVAEIIGLGETQDDAFESMTSGLYVTVAKDSTKKQVYAELKLRCQVLNEGADSQIYFKGNSITYNSRIEVLTDKYAATAYIKSFSRRVLLETE